MHRPGFAQYSSIQVYVGHGAHYSPHVITAINKYMNSYYKWLGKLRRKTSGWAGTCSCIVEVLVEDNATLKRKINIFIAETE